MNSIDISGDLTQIMPVTNIGDWLHKFVEGYDQDEEWGEKEGEQYNLIGEIIATEVSIYLLRRIGYVCGSNIDSMRSIRRGLMNKYHVEYGEELVTGNDDVDF
jgi:tRNA(Ile)-lysidine synthase TilS/MesJ